MPNSKRGGRLAGRKRFRNKLPKLFNDKGDASKSKVDSKKCERVNTGNLTEGNSKSEANGIEPKPSIAEILEKSSAMRAEVHRKKTAKALIAVPDAKIKATGTATTKTSEKSTEMSKRKKMTEPESETPTKKVKNESALCGYDTDDSDEEWTHSDIELLNFDSEYYDEFSNFDDDDSDDYYGCDYDYDEVYGYSSDDEFSNCDDDYYRDYENDEGSCADDDLYPDDEDDEYPSNNDVDDNKHKLPIDSTIKYDIPDEHDSMDGDVHEVPQTIKTVQQPEAYSIEAMMKLNKKYSSSYRTKQAKISVKFNDSSIENWDDSDDNDNEVLDQKEHEEIFNNNPSAAYSMQENLYEGNLNENSFNYSDNGNFNMRIETNENGYKERAIIDVHDEADNDMEFMFETKGNGQNIFCNAINSNKVLVLLEKPIYIYGTVCVTLLQGSINIYGYTPPLNKCLNIYSPRGYSLVRIATCAFNSDIVTQCDMTDQLYKMFNKADVNEVLNGYKPSTNAIVLLQRNVDAKKLISNFKKFMNQNVFPNINLLQHDASANLLQCVIKDQCDHSLQMPKDWRELTLESNSKMLIVGGKSVGKSTLLRFIINRHLAKFKSILLIDLDIGQPEMFVPQTISCSILTEPLLGPGFFLNCQPAKAYLVGHVNISFCAENYMRAVKQLLSYCYEQQSYKELPWLINTMGYNKGFGLELLACIVDYVKPTDIVQMESNKDINNFDEPLELSTLKAVRRIIFSAPEFQVDNAEYSHCELHMLNSVIQQDGHLQKDWYMSAKDMRYAMLLARLSAALQGSAEWLTDCTPFIAPMNEVHLLSSNADDTREMLIAGAESNLVYLCKMNIKLESLECFGIGIVRGIDQHVGKIYLIPAAPTIQLKNVNCLFVGALTLPNSIFTNQGPKVLGAAPFIFSTLDTKASKAIRQIYHRPAEFLNNAHRATD